MSAILEKITNELLAWGQANFILINPTEEPQTFELPKFGNCYLVVPYKGKIVDEEMRLVFDIDSGFEFEGVQVLVENKKVDYLIFEFGKLFYYCKPVLMKDNYGELRYSIDFLDLKYVGTCTEPDAAVNHLGIHTEYDLLSGNGLKNYLKKAKHFGCTHVGMCDRNTLAGTLAWQVESQKAGLKSVLGETVVVATNYNPETPTTVPITYELKLYIATWEGWQNLLQINKLINVDYPKFIPEVELQKYQKGLICVAGYGSYLNFKNKAEVVKWLHKFKNFEHRYFQVDCSEFFAPADDLQRLGQINDYLKGNYLTLLPPILIQDVYYCDRDMYIVRDYLNKVAKRAWDYSEDQYFKSWNEILEQMGALFQYAESFAELLSTMLENLQAVCDVCGKFELETGTRLLPIYENDLGLTSEELFLQITLQGFEERIMSNPELDHQTYLERLELELETIKEGNLENYFLILWDILSWCRQNGISVGPGRGSVAGSLVAFCCYLTDVDSIKHDLLFSRFLNKTRILPEIKYRVEYDDGTIELLNQEQFERLNYDRKI
jgi:DNA polymerase-3 subunit alpha